MADEKGPDKPISTERLADPTPLTTAALSREVGHVRIEINSLESNITTRLNAMDKAVALFKDDLVRVPTDTDKQVSNLKEKVNIQIEGLKDVILQKFGTVEEKFNGVDKQFQFNEIALNAALSAAKEAVGKQNESSTLATAKAEASSTKLMDQMRDIVNTNNGGLNDKIDEGRNRTTVLEQRLVGLLQDVAQIRAVPPFMPPVQAQTSAMPWIMGGIGLFLLVIILILEVMQRGALR